MLIIQFTEAPREIHGAFRELTSEHGDTKLRDGWDGSPPSLQGERGGNSPRLFNDPLSLHVPRVTGFMQLTVSSYHFSDTRLRCFST